jgi:acetolactate synthase-1/2/3 large subunit
VKCTAIESVKTPTIAKEVSGSVALLEALIVEGVETIFGYPGGAIMPIYDALYDYNDRLNHILVRHEQGGIHAGRVMRVHRAKWVLYLQPAAPVQPI